MARNPQYGRWQRVATQVVMWVVFASTLALAGYVSHRRAGPLYVELGEPAVFGRLVAATRNSRARMARELYEGNRAMSPPGSRVGAWPSSTFDMAPWIRRSR